MGLPRTTPADADAAGISIIYQELSVINELSAGKPVATLGAAKAIRRRNSRSPTTYQS
ncbi:hypothetical protein HGP14_34085 [Rhizobium sp. P32RR-XVIII]|uniref:hypothetical protein n=1 Tax=Rhizobium sp. P32RR-XVIII TaxID=2726738 RepID=UPI0014577EC3|nr:hypothetical protein [Rhizobium sp. P32RR-XVIII]NLS08223.1 hypothetical protein [Rhizobium sp. P32RR-XVIII]